MSGQDVAATGVLRHRVLSVAVGYSDEMAGISEYVWVIGILGFVLLLVYLYVASIRKVLATLGFTEGEASAILAGTLFLGWLTIPIFPYGGWWVGLSVGGAIIPIAICVNFLLRRRVGVGEAFIGITIVAYITYTVTRAEEGVGIVADVPLAFAPALAAGLFALSVVWMDVRNAARLAYVSGVLGTLIGADVFRLWEMLSFQAPEGEFSVLSIGGANIFDMVYLTGVVAVGLAVLVLWVKTKRDRIGFGTVVSEFERGAAEAPRAREFQPARKIAVRKGRLE